MATFNTRLTIPTPLPEDQKIQTQAITPVTSITAPTNIPVLSTPVIPTVPVDQTNVHTQLTEAQKQLIPLLEKQRNELQTQVSVPKVEPATQPEVPTTQPEMPQTESFDTILSQSGLAAGSLEDVIKNVSAAYGIEGINNEITKLEDSFIEKTSEINNNPWLSEGIRTNKVAQERNKYEQKKDALVNNLRLRQDVIGKAIDTYYREREFKKDILFKQLDARQKALEAEKIKTPTVPTTQDITEYNLARSQGYTGTLLDYQRDLANLKAKATVTAGGKPPTAQQETVATYAARLEQSSDIFDKLAGDIAAYGTVGYAAVSNLPSFAQPAEIQQQQQAERNFLNATLRRESGAVISPTEFAEGRRQYFPQPGDSPEVLAQKKANRELVTRSFARASGPAYVSYKELLGEVTPATATARINQPETRMFQGALYKKVSGGWQKVK